MSVRTPRSSELKTTAGRPGAATALVASAALAHARTIPAASLCANPLATTERFGIRDQNHMGRTAHLSGSVVLVRIPSPPVSTATLHTNHGAIALELHDADAPKTVENFLDLARKGFYDGVIFHHVKIGRA